MQSYINERLEIHRAVFPSPSIIYGTTGSPLAEWETEVIENDGGYRHAFQNREQAIGKWDVGSFTYNLEEWEYLLNFFIDKRGSAIAFRYKDWSDFEAINQQIGVGNGTNTIFQLQKTYLDYDRLINKPVSGTVKIYLNGVLQASGFSVDHETGVITFSSAPASGVVITSDFEFDVRVRFETDDLPATFVAFSPSDGEKFVDVGNMSIIETLIPQSINQNYYMAFNPTALTTHSFSIVAPDIVQSWNAVECYFRAGESQAWDDCGTLGMYPANCIMGYIQVYSGVELLIGTTKTISGTVTNLISGDCGVAFKLVWKRVS